MLLFGFAAIVILFTVLWAVSLRLQNSSIADVAWGPGILLIGLTYYFTQMLAFEGEFTGSVGWAQDVVFERQDIIHNQMPTVWSYSGNLVFFPGGASGKQMPFYVTGGIGNVLLSPRVPTKIFGYDVDTTGTQFFLAENIGGGIKLFRGADAPNWGFRIDYRYLIVNENDDAPQFFAQSAVRGGHRIYAGMLYTWKR